MYFNEEEEEMNVSREIRSARLLALCAALAGLTVSSAAGQTASAWSRQNPKYPDELDFAIACLDAMPCNDLTPLNDHSSKGIGWNHYGKTFVCSLDTSADLRFVEVELPRGSRATLVKEIQVSVDDGSGDFGPSRSVVTYGAFDHYPRAGEPKVNDDCTNHWYKVEGLGRAARVKVTVSGEAWHECGEIRICGKAVDTAVPSPRAERGRATVLRNPHWEVAVDPFGGRAVKLLAKDVGIDFAASEGAFTEDCWNVPQSAWYFLNRPFTLEPDGKGRSLKASASALGSGISFLEIVKDYRLDGNRLHVDYAIRNQPAAMSDQSFSPRVRMRLGAGKGPTTYVFPTARGLREVSDVNPPPDLLLGDFVRGWFAVKDASGKGVLVRLDEAEVAALRVVFPKGECARIEWSLPPVFVLCGKSYPVKATLEAFSKLDDVLTAADRLPTRGKARRSDPVRDYDFNCYTNFPKTVSRGWARPQAQGPVKALMLSTFSDNVEIGLMAERFDIDFKTTVFAYDGKSLDVGDPKWWIGDYFNVATRKDFLRSLKQAFDSDWQVLVLGGIPFAALPEEVRKPALEKIRAGAGLVTVGQSVDDPDIGVTGRIEGRREGVPTRTGDVFAAVPFELLGSVFAPRFEKVPTMHAMLHDTPFVAETKVGGGTHVRLCYNAVGGSNAAHSPRGSVTPPFAGFMADGVPPAESYYLLVYKAMLRAIGRPNPFGLAKVKLDGRTAEFALNAPAEGETAWEWSVRTTFGEVLRQGRFKAALKKGANAVSLKDFAPPVYGDRLCLRLAVRTRKNKVLDFGEWAFENRPAAEVVEVKADRRYYDEYETVKFTAKMKGAAEAARVTAALVDGWGRTVASRRVEPKDEIAGEFRIENDLPSKQYELRVTVADADGREVSRRRAELKVCPDPKKDPWNDFEPGGWFPDNVREHLWPMFAKLCDEEMRYKIILANHEPMQNGFSTRFNFSSCCLSAAGLWRSPEPKEYAQTGDKMKLVRTPCLSHPDRKAATVRNLTAAAATSHRDGARFIWLGDELSLTGYGGQPIDFCFGEHCLKGFRAWLKTRYGSLAALNAEWGTDFADWDAVLPFTRQEIWAEGGMRHVAGWADHLEFMDGVYVDAERLAKESAKKVDPRALLATSGTQQPSAYGALDWWRQTRQLDGLLSYATAGMMEVHRSFLDGKDSFLLPWEWGYARRGPSAVRALWKVAFLGAKGVMGFESSTMIAQDFTLSKPMLDTYQAIHRLTDGAGMHLINNLKERHEVAVLYSQSSIRAAFIEKRVEEHSDNREKWMALMRNVGANWRFLSYDELMAGDLVRKGFKALVLADATALADKELAAIADFRAKGGVVLAEGLPGRRTWNCRERAPAPDWNFRHWKRAVDAAYFKAVRNPLLPENAAEIARAQAAVRKALADAKCAFDGVRIFDAETGKPVTVAEMFPRTDAAGNPFYGVLSDDAVPRRARFAFGGKSHVYDLVSGRYYGFVDSVELPLGQAVGYGFELLKEKLKLEVEVEERTGNPVLEVALNTPVDTVVQVQVFGPDGKPVRAYRKNLLVKGGKASWRIPFVASDAKGRWKAVVTNVLGGEKKEVEVMR